MHICTISDTTTVTKWIPKIMAKSQQEIRPRICHWSDKQSSLCILTSASNTFLNLSRKKQRAWPMFHLVNLVHISTSNHLWGIISKHASSWITLTNWQKVLNRTSIHVLFHTTVDIWKIFICEKALLLQATFLRIIPTKKSLTASKQLLQRKQAAWISSGQWHINLSDKSRIPQKPNCGAFCGKPNISPRSQQTNLKSRRKWHHTFQTWGPDQDTCKINHK